MVKAWSRTSLPFRFFGASSSAPPASGCSLVVLGSRAVTTRSVCDVEISWPRATTRGRRSLFAITDWRGGVFGCASSVGDCGTTAGGTPRVRGWHVACRGVRDAGRLGRRCEVEGESECGESAQGSRLCRVCAEGHMVDTFSQRTQGVHGGTKTLTVGQTSGSLPLHQPSPFPRGATSRGGGAGLES